MTALPSFLREGATPKTLRTVRPKWPFDVRLAKRHGVRICCWCGGDLPKGRQSWCSEACVLDYKTKHDWHYIRNQVEKRDLGVCALCGVDTEKVKRVLRAMRRMFSFAAMEWACQALGGFSLAGDQWQADHIHPRADGGSNALDNLRTLCVPCHKLVTKKFVGELARRRREAKPSPLFSEEAK